MSVCRHAIVRWSIVAASRRESDGIQEVAGWTPVGSTLRLALLRNGRLLKVKARARGLMLDEPSQGSLGGVLTIGSQRYCTLFSGAVARTVDTIVSPPGSG